MTGDCGRLVTLDICCATRTSAGFHFPPLRRGVRGGGRGETPAWYAVPGFYERYRPPEWTRSLTWIEWRSPAYFLTFTWKPAVCKARIKSVAS